MTRQEKALQGRIERLGTPNPKCVLCGESDIRATYYRVTPKQRAFLEKHHILGRHEGPIALLCRNCHDKETFEMQVNWSKELKKRDRDPATLIHALTRWTFDTLKCIYSDRRVCVFAAKLHKEAIHFIEGMLGGENVNPPDIQKLFEEAFKCCLLDTDMFNEWPNRNLDGDNTP
jgi:hypothetical protein